MREHNVYRGKIISLHQRQDRCVSVQFHGVRAVDRDSVILPDGILERVERHTVGIVAQVERLREVEHHIKRGVLLHGPPGTGKTLTLSYLLGVMPGRTTILLTGRGLGLIEQALGLAYELAPATVVPEDVDLVAAERTSRERRACSSSCSTRWKASVRTPICCSPDHEPPRHRRAGTGRAPGPRRPRRRAPTPRRGRARPPAARLRTRDRPRSRGRSGPRDAHQGRQRRVHQGAHAPSRAACRAGRRRAGHRGDVRAVLDDRSALTRRLLGQPADGSPADAAAATPLPGMLRAFEAAGLPLPAAPERG